MRTIAISILGAVLDAGKEKRWSQWRPTVAMCSHEDLLVDELYLIHQSKEQGLLDTVVTDVAAISPETTVVPYAVKWKDAWDFEEVYAKLHAFSRTISVDPESAELLVGITTGTHVAQICLYLLTESRHLPGKLIQLSPPKRKDPNVHLGSWRTIDLDLSRYDSLASRFELEQQEGSSFLKSGIVTKNRAFNALIERIEQVSIASKHPMLLTGPTGAGKSHLAKRIFELKKIRNQLSGSFVAVNCATLVGEHAVSTLFGHAKGAFTGAIEPRSGLLKTADGGVLFLDEVGELGLDEQAMLLKAVEEKQFLPLGSDREVDSDFQLIAGTNRNLRDAAMQGRFRDDLLARIDLWMFELPGLADRREDIEANLEYELQRYTDTTGNTVRFTAKAKREFLDFAHSEEATWEANFRDLNAAMTRMATLAEGGRIGSANVAEEVGRLKAGWRYAERSINDSDPETERTLARLLGADWRSKQDLFDQQQLVDVVQVCRDSRTLAAAGRKLFAVSRKAKQNPNDSDRLRKYLAKLGILWKDIVAAEG